MTTEADQTYPSMITVEQARGLLIASCQPLSTETVDLAEAAGRVLAAPLLAARAQPACDVSAMDGFALHYAPTLAEVGTIEARWFRVIGEARAGVGFADAVGEGECVRIFTGAPVPVACDHVVIQEETEWLEAGWMAVTAPQRRPANIRAAGLDFRAGDRLLDAGQWLDGARLALAAAGNVSTLVVHRRPRVALIANGDELALPGQASAEAQVVCSSPYGLLSLFRQWGAEADFLGIAGDSQPAIAAMIERARDYDLIVPIGGASVGDHDLMQGCFAAAGLQPIFARVRMKPGKPVWSGRLVRQAAGGASGPLVLGLPGNPASSLVTARLFGKPLVERLTGRAGCDDTRPRTGRLVRALPANGPRMAFLRASQSWSEAGVCVLDAGALQDSGTLTAFAGANALLIREAGAPAADAGALVPWLPL